MQFFASYYAPLPPPPTTACSHTCSWAMQVLQVQKMINNRPARALGGRMTRSQALFGALDQCSVLPKVEWLAELLQLNRSGEGGAGGE